MLVRLCVRHDARGLYHGWALRLYEEQPILRVSDGVGWTMAVSALLNSRVQVRSSVNELSKTRAARGAGPTRDGRRAEGSTVIHSPSPRDPHAATIRR